jgi:2,4-diketo-3-deoxy-L-fuconate hydrolase
MVFAVVHLVSHISRFTSLNWRHHFHRHTSWRRNGSKAAVYLRPGNRIRLGIDGLGEQNQNVVDGK